MSPATNKCWHFVSCMLGDIGPMKHIHFFKMLSYKLSFSLQCETAFWEPLHSKCSYRNFFCRFYLDFFKDQSLKEGNLMWNRIRLYFTVSKRTQVLTVFFSFSVNNNSPCIFPDINVQCKYFWEREEIKASSSQCSYLQILKCLR